MKLKNRLFITLVSSLVLMSCGENNKTSQATEAASQPQNLTASGAVEEEGTVEIILSSDDRMRFDKNQIEVFAGQTVRLTLEHTGSMPKTSMGHNFVLLAQGVDVNSFGQKAANASGNDYIPQDEVDNIIAHTKMIGGGERDVITFDAPGKGTYDFICSFPGHYGIMKGKFIVK